MRSLVSIGGRVKVAALSDLESSRYEFLSLSQAEPNLGAPSSDNGIVASSTSGERVFLNPNQGLSVTSSDDLFVDETTVPIDTSEFNLSSSNHLSDVLADLDQGIRNVINNVDGGFANSVYLQTQIINGGSASG